MFTLSRPRKEIGRGRERGRGRQDTRLDDAIDVIEAIRIFWGRAHTHMGRGRDRHFNCNNHFSFLSRRVLMTFQHTHTHTQREYSGKSIENILSLNNYRTEFIQLTHTHTDTRGDILNMSSISHSHWQAIN